VDTYAAQVQAITDRLAADLKSKYLRPPQ
jgi:hypothetical protein